MYVFVVACNSNVCFSFLSLSRLELDQDVSGYFSPSRLSERAAFLWRIEFLLNKPPTHQNITLSPIMTRAAGQPKMVAIIGCHKKGEQSNAAINAHGSI